MKRQVYQSPLFERQKKYLSKKEIEHLDNEIEVIQGRPEIGEAKRGDLVGVAFMTPVIAGSINRTPTGPHRRCDMFINLRWDGNYSCWLMN